MKIRKQYYKTVNKYGINETLNMYRDGKIELNDNEWKNLHHRFNKRYIDKFKKPTLISLVICISIMVIFSLCMNTDNFDKIKQCNKIQGHTCSKYEIDKIDVESRGY